LQIKDVRHNKVNFSLPVHSSTYKSASFSPQYFPSSMKMTIPWKKRLNGLVICLPALKLPKTSVNNT